MKSVHAFIELEIKGVLLDLVVYGSCDGEYCNIDTISYEVGPKWRSVSKSLHSYIEANYEEYLVESLASSYYLEYN